MAIPLLAEAAGAAAVSSAWEYLDPDLEAPDLYDAVCPTPDGGVTTLVKPNSGSDRRPVVLTLSRQGEPVRKVLPELPRELGEIGKARACRWAGNDGLVVIVSTRAVGLAAIWLDPGLSITDWLVLEKDRNTGARPWAISEVGPERFIAVGTNMVNAYAVRFDRRRVEPLTMPWAEDRDRGLMDVRAEPDGGFSVCGLEGELKGATKITSTYIVVATFDEAGALRGESRLPGKICRLLSRRSGRLRVLHDDGLGGSRTLSLATLDDGLQPLSDEPLATPFAFFFHIPLVEMDERLFMVNAWFGWETLEVRGPTSRESIDLDVRPGGIVELVPGPSRIYLVSSTSQKGQPGEMTRFGVRVDAFDVEAAKQ